MTRPKIFLITHNYPRHENDNAGIFVKNLVSDLSDYFDFTVCHIYYGGLMKDLFKNPLNWPKLADYYRKSMRKAKCELKCHKHHLIWSHWWLPAGIIGAKLSRRTGHPLMVTMHGTDAAMLKSLPILKPVAAYVFKQARVVNTVSSYLASFTTPDAVAANMPFDPEVFNYSETERDDKLIICPARLDQGKNVDLLVKAVKQISELKLKIFGEGPKRDHILSLIDKNPRIELHDFIPQKQLADQFRQAGVVALPSSVEGFGLVLAEGAACGCYPIATRAASMIEIVKQVGGQLFELDKNGDDIKRALEHYLRSLPIERGKISKNASVFSKSVIIPRFVEMINSAIKNPPEKNSQAG